MPFNKPSVRSLGWEIHKEVVYEKVGSGEDFITKCSAQKLTDLLPYKVLLQTKRFVIIGSLD